MSNGVIQRSQVLEISGVHVSTALQEVLYHFPETFRSRDMQGSAPIGVGGAGVHAVYDESFHLIHVSISRSLAKKLATFSDIKHHATPTVSQKLGNRIMLMTDSVVQTCMTERVLRVDLSPILKQEFDHLNLAFRCCHVQWRSLEWVRNVDALALQSLDERIDVASRRGVEYKLGPIRLASSTEKVDTLRQSIVRSHRSLVLVINFRFGH
mmetsp:Transcript_5267/g.17053  ORF Transcript_5267/g.17053 Transcript_5267/m.17053 type:complete len:210 (+) Transcript_5267:303-932(+)